MLSLLPTHLQTLFFLNFPTQTYKYLGQRIKFPESYFYFIYIFYTKFLFLIQKCWPPLDLQWWNHIGMISVTQEKQGGKKKMARFFRVFIYLFNSRQNKTGFFFCFIFILFIYFVWVDKSTIKWQKIWLSQPTCSKRIVCLKTSTKWHISGQASLPKPTCKFLTVSSTAMALCQIVSWLKLICFTDVGDQGSNPGKSQVFRKLIKKKTCIVNCFILEDYFKWIALIKISLRCDIFPLGWKLLYS